MPTGSKAGNFMGNNLIGPEQGFVHEDLEITTKLNSFSITLLAPSGDLWLCRSKFGALLPASVN